jgi:hypothetical protein
LIVFCVVFGLSMDYEVFLVARIAEARAAGMSDDDAIVEGLARTGGLISSAAAIMIAVFAAFTLGDFVLIKILGFALSVAVLVDATVMRLAVGPALLKLGGRWNWWPGETYSSVRSATGGRLLRGAAVTCALLVSASRLGAQSAPDSVAVRTDSVEPKSGTTATVLSLFVPGLGHLYAEDRRTAAVLLTLFAGAIALHATGENAASSPIAALVGAGPWFYGVIDAHNAAARYNRAHAPNATAFVVYPAMVVATRGPIQLGIVLRVAFR